MFQRPLPLALPAPPLLLALPAPADSGGTMQGHPAALASPLVAPSLAFEDDFTDLGPALPPPSPADERDTLRLVDTIATHIDPVVARPVPSAPAPQRPPEPDPWLIMPARTLRRAGHRHLIRQREPEEPEDDLLTQAEREPRHTPERGTPTSAAPSTLRHDILIVPSRPDFRASDQGVKALLLWLDRSQLLRAPQISSLEEFVGHPGHLHAEVWRARMLGGADGGGQLIALGAGGFAHQLFREGEAPKGPPVLLSGLIGHRTRPGPVPFGPPGLEAAFWLALVGSAFPRVTDAVLARLHDILHLRPGQHASPHAGPLPTP